MSQIRDFTFSEFRLDYYNITEIVLRKIWMAANWKYEYIHIFIYVNCMFNSTILVLVFFCRFAIELKYNIIVVIYHWTLICMIFMYILILKYKNKQTKWYGDQISAAFNCSIVDACMIRVVCFILRRLREGIQKKSIFF